ncbi:MULTISPECIES: efflux RND transporter periplasmic adaptor subunit [Chitinophagaceae]|uniref:efflux RND transporter periplasmic adaptor subunit n=1 Tax=Chitinophagaceae TaxID=563835 RepID=UPI000DEF8968|nr:MULTISPECIES: efflux RND transporter periplasmic adaptor subunit [Chitinophagaceae]RPD51145.1 efflux RND transporter periplasmic adaptor subunit [Paracnuella aquatica]
MKRVFFLISIWLFAYLALLVACNDGKKVNADGHEHQAAAEVYTCPMHPEIVRNAPGSCPVCGMDLVKKETDAKRLANVGLETLLRPADAFVVSSVPVTALQQREEDLELDVVGTIAYDTRQAGAISSRVGGRIERLYIRYKYQPVKKGQAVMDIYSPELMTAQQNLLFVLRNDPANQSLINAAKDRLLLLGMTNSQVVTLMRTRKPKYAVTVYSQYSGFVTDLGAPALGVSNSGPGGMGAGGDAMQSAPVTGGANSGTLQLQEGSYVQSGQAVLSVYNAARAWVLLDIYPEQQNLIKPGDPVRVVPETAPQQNFRAQVDYIEPIFRAGSKTLNARVFFNNAALKLPVGSRVTATIFGQPKKSTWLPKEALLSLGRDRIVFLREGSGFKAHKVLTGLELNRLVQITGGLQPTDSVAANAQYLVDNEAFIKVQEP